MAASEHEPVYCARHPSVETAISCATCGTPICPDCMVQAPVGIKCRDCARLPRSALVRLKPERALRAVAAGIALAAAVAVVLALLQRSGTGFFGFFIAFGVGSLVGEAVIRASGYHRAQITGAIAAASALAGYVGGHFLTPVLSNVRVGHGTLGFQLLLGAVAAFIAFRRAA